MRNRMIAGNWKMNKTYTEGVQLAQDLAEALSDGTGNVDVVVCPPTVDLKGVSTVIDQQSAPFALGAQNVYWEESGAYTGETAPNMLEAVGATYCIIGHSERRDYFHETDEDVNKKAKTLMAHNIVPISCCGEPLEIREAGTHVAYVVDQIKKDTEGLEISDPAKYVVAYEPIWAIGTGKTPPLTMLRKFAVPSALRSPRSLVRRQLTASVFFTAVLLSLRTLQASSRRKMLMAHS